MATSLHPESAERGRLDAEILGVLDSPLSDSSVPLSSPPTNDDGDAHSSPGIVFRRTRKIRRCTFLIGGMAILATAFVNWSRILRTTQSLTSQSPSSAKSFFDVNSAARKVLKSGDAVPLREKSNKVLRKVNEKDHVDEKKSHFPVIEEDDNAKIPGWNTAASSASDALECRDSVIAFVINATDVKDECDGLRKAFDKTCNSDSAQEIIEGQKAAEGGGRRRRHLFESKKAQHWKLHTYQLSRSLHRFAKTYLSWHRRELFFPEEEVMGDAWEEAQYQVSNKIDYVVHEPLRRRLEEARILEWRRRVQAENATSTDTKHIDKPKQSLSLPTASEHVSEKVLSETLMLQQEEGVIKSAMEAAANHTNVTMKEAAVDAVVSSKAVSDTTDAVAAVLNDPTSVEARTCCTSILNVYHENCDFPQGEEVSDQRLVIIIFVIAFCGLVKSLIRYFEIRWLPEAAGCILVGVVGGGILSVVPHYDISFDGNWFLRIMVPPIVFEAALSIDKSSFNRHRVPIAFYAVAGTLLSTVITAFIVHRGTVLLHAMGLCEKIPYVESLTFGALISSIDPIAVLSVLSNMGMTDTDTIYVVIFGESLLNDGVAIVLFQTLVHFLDESLIIDGDAVLAATLHFFVVALGSLAVGIASGAICTVYYWAMHKCQTPLVEVLMFFCWAFIPYYICDGVGWSGIVAVVATGFVMDLYVVGQKGEAVSSTVSDSAENGNGSPKKRERTQRRRIFSEEGHLSAMARTHVGFVTEILATMMETAIFAYLGLFLFSYRYHWNFYHATMAIVACCIGRAVMIPSMSFLANWITSVQQIRENCRPRILRTRERNNPAGVIIDSRMQLVLWFAGLRGAMSFALVEHIPMYDTVTGEGSRLKPELKTMTSATIVFTVFVLGGYTYYLTERLGLAPSKEDKSIEMMSLVRKPNKDSETNGTDALPFSLEQAAQPERFFRQRHGTSPDSAALETVPTIASF